MVLTSVRPAWVRGVYFATDCCSSSRRAIKGSYRVTEAKMVIQVQELAKRSYFAE